MYRPRISFGPPQYQVCGVYLYTLANIRSNLFVCPLHGSKGCGAYTETCLSCTGITRDRQLLLWRHHISVPITILRDVTSQECLAYSEWKHAPSAAWCILNWPWTDALLMLTIEQSFLNSWVAVFLICVKLEIMHIVLSRVPRLLIMHIHVVLSRGPRLLIMHIHVVLSRGPRLLIMHIVLSRVPRLLISSHFILVILSLSNQRLFFISLLSARKAPILLFSGTKEGDILKWEKQPSQSGFRYAVTIDWPRKLSDKLLITLL